MAWNWELRDWPEFVRDRPALAARDELRVAAHAHRRQRAELRVLQRQPDQQPELAALRQLLLHHLPEHDAADVVVFNKTEAGPKDRRSSAVVLFADEQVTHLFLQRNDNHAAALLCANHRDHSSLVIGSRLSRLKSRSLPLRNRTA